MWMRTLALGLLRAWLAFVIIATPIAIVAAALDGDNLLKSDDPYVLGFALGSIAAAMAGIYTVAERIRRNRAWIAGCYFAVLTVWCAFLLAGSMLGSESEGAEILLYAAGASMFVGIAVWPLFPRRASRKGVVVLSVAGLGMFALYGVTVLHMRLRNFP